MTDEGPAGARVSVVIPTHDRAAQVRVQVEDLLAGATPPDQVVVVADGCSDATEQVLAELAEPRVLVLATAGVGPASARNLGAAAATGDWLVFLDDDDLPGPGWMTTWRELVAAHPGSSYLSVPYLVRSGTDDRLRPVHRLGPSFSSVRACYMPGTYAVRADAFAASGGFADGLRYLECTELAMRLFDVLAADAGAFAEGGEPTIVRVGRPPEQRASVRPEVLVPSSRTAHRTMAPFLRRDPRLRADSLAALGVAEIRIGDGRAGRATLRTAARADPRNPRHLARAVLAHLGPLGRLAWTRGRA